MRFRRMAPTPDTAGQALPATEACGWSLQHVSAMVETVGDANRISGMAALPGNHAGSGCCCTCGRLVLLPCHGRDWSADRTVEPAGIACVTNALVHQDPALSPSILVRPERGIDRISWEERIARYENTAGNAASTRLPQAAAARRVWCGQALPLEQRLRSPGCMACHQPASTTDRDTITHCGIPERAATSLGLMTAEPRGRLLVEPRSSGRLPFLRGLRPFGGRMSFDREKRAEGKAWCSLNVGRKHTPRTGEPNLATSAEQRRRRSESLCRRDTGAMGPPRMSSYDARAAEEWKPERDRDRQA
jgi:hypothetical protein